MDPISNMLTTIRNSLAINKASCVMPFSKINFEIARILKENKFIEDFKKEIEKDEKFEKIKVSLKYDNELIPAITEIKRVSKLGRRVYVGYNDIRLPRFGITILSTPQGMMTSAKAKRMKVGGEVICSLR
jgi:small subunit ribosomal protein S8